MTKPSSEQKKEIPAFIETPVGLFTPSGNWFFTSEKKLKAYASKLFEIHPLPSIIKKAEIWIRSTDIIGIIISMLTLISMSALSALAVTAVCSFLWNRFRPAFIQTGLTKLLKWTGNDLVLLTLAVIPLSWMGMEEMYLNLGVGLGLFLMFKFGWIRQFFDSLSKHKRAISINDRILNMLIIKYAIMEGISVSSIEQMESDIIKAMEKSAKQRNRRK